MRKLQLLFASLLIVAWMGKSSIAAAQLAGEPVVRAIVFYSPACPHCHQVIKEVLTPMAEEYGARLQVVAIDIDQPDGGRLYQMAIERYQIPNQRRGVPTLIIGDTVLVGSREIPQKFPTLVEEGLAAGGIDWPDIPGLDQAIPPLVEPDSSPIPTPQPAATVAPTPVPQATNVSSLTTEARATTPPTLTPIPVPSETPAPAGLIIDGDELPPLEPETPPSDRPGFALAGVVLLGMVAALAYAGLHLKTAWQYLFRLDRSPAAIAKTWAIPFLSLAGLGVAIYLAYVEITHVEAVCGPVGQCNIVQASPYAQILGIPIAVLGVLNYLAVGLLWAGQRYPLAKPANLSALALLGLTLFGLLFSIYLTLLELFVIHAVCAWCLGSAIISTLLMLLVVLPVTGDLSTGKLFNSRS